jgi:parvulin-like peptidyl-prolyl isomerase
MRVPVLAPALSLVLMMSAAHGADSGDELVARMGGYELRRGEVKHLADAQRVDLKGDPNTVALALEQVARTELIRRAVLAEAKKSQWEKRPEVQQQIDQARDQVIVTSFMDSAARPPASYPSPEELQRAYEENKAAFTVPQQYRVAQIYLAYGSDPAQAERRAQELSNQAREKNSDFSELARKNSAHAQSAAKGGDMGWLSADQLLPELRPVLSAMQIGEVSKPIKAADGWHVLRLAERKAPSVLPLNDVKDRLTEALRLRKAQQNEREYLNKLLSQTPISVNEIALTSLINAAKPAP